jgi:hypothetical protein
MDSVNVFYLRIDTLGNILDEARRISIRTAYISMINGVVDRAGNIHFVWSNQANLDFWPMYFRVSPEGEILDSTRRLALRTSSLIKDHNENLWLWSPSGVSNLKMYKFNDDGHFTGDSLIMSNIRNGNVSLLAFDPRDNVYLFFGKARVHNVSIRCTVFDLNGNIILPEQALTDSLHEGPVATVNRVAITSDSLIFMVYTTNNGPEYRIRGMNLGLDTLFDFAFARSYSIETEQMHGTLDAEGNYHIAWQTDTGDQGLEYRYHLSYAIIDQQGEFVSEPQWISEHGAQFWGIRVLSNSLNSRNLIFVKIGIRAYPLVAELYYKHYPDDERRVDFVSPTSFSGTLHATPNPTNGRVVLQVGDYLSKIQDIEVYDINGRMIVNYTMSSFEINYSEKSLYLPNNLMPGLYFARVNTSSGTLTTRFVVVK